MIRSSWTARHGDTARSKVWIPLGADGTGLDLDQWTVRAHAKEHIDDDDAAFTFLVGHGITLKRAKVRVSTGGLVETSTVQLYLLPSYYSSIPRPWSGIVDVEISSDSTSAPLQRYTVAEIDLDITRDVTR